MASGFLLAEALAEALRRPYHKGNVQVTARYLAQRLAIGEHRVMLKRNFDTACWVPPVGKRAAHSIYYGDRMVERVIERFCRIEKVTLPPKELFILEILARRKAKYDVDAAKAAVEGKKFPPMPMDVGRSAVFEAKLVWLKGFLSVAKWNEMLELIVEAVFAYGRHERQHARETPQDLKKVSSDLKALGIPFTYFNLFEDARIEHISRTETGVKFDWNAFEDMAPANSPFAVFLRCIQNEGEPDLEALESEEMIGFGTQTLGDVASRIDAYYRRAIVCLTAEHLYPIMVEFLEEFKAEMARPLPPLPPKGGGGGEGGSGGGSAEPGSAPSEGSGSSGDGEEDDNGDAEDRADDLTTAADAAEKGDSFFDEFERDAEVVGGTDAEGADAEAKAKEKLRGNADRKMPDGKGGKGAGIPDSFEPTESGGRASEEAFLATIAGSLDKTQARRVDALTVMLMRMFKSHTLPAVTETVGKRMSTRHLARGEYKYVHKRVYGGKGKRRYSVVYDCSGSMGGRPDHEGKLLLLALNRLARNGYLEGSLVLSGCVRGKPSWLQYKFPVADTVILRIRPNHNAEGLQNSLADNLKHIKGMDDVFVYTDANITDTPLNREYFAKQRIWPVGLYVGSDEMSGEMNRHFPQNIIRNTIEEVVAAMLTRNRRTVG